MVRVEKTPILSSSSCQSTAAGESSFADLELSGSSFSSDGGAILVGVLELSSHRHDLVDAIAVTLVFEYFVKRYSRNGQTKKLSLEYSGSGKRLWFGVVFFANEISNRKKINGRNRGADKEVEVVCGGAVCTFFLPAAAPDLCNLRQCPDL